MDYIIYYVLIGFVLNTGLALLNYYRGLEEDYILIPHPFVYFITIFSWPLTLWDLISGFNEKEEDK